MKQLVLTLTLTLLPFSVFADLSEPSDFDRLSAELSLLTCEVISHQSAVMVFDSNSAKGRATIDLIRSSFEEQNCADVLEKSFEKVFSDGQVAAASRQPLRLKSIQNTLDRIHSAAGDAASFVSEDTLGY